MTKLPFGWSENKWLLIIGNTVLGVALIVLSQNDVLPLDPIDFLFFTFIGLLIALYRPGWSFLLLIGMLPYETVSLAPREWGMDVRPYQWFLVLTTLSLALRFLLRRFPFQSFRLNRWDGALILVGCSAFISAFGGDIPGTALRLSVIFASFLLLYFLCRFFIRSVDDARMLVPFFLSSLLVVAGYALWQNIAFLGGRESFEAMAGRPNATFPEADWLGGYLAVFVTALIALIVSPTLLSKYASIRKIRTVFSVVLFFVVLALVLTVSRSAWLSAAFGTAVALTLFASQRGVFGALYWQNRQVLKRASYVFLFIAIPITLAILSVMAFRLTPFDLFDRGKSLSSGEQKITVSCEEEKTLPERIVSMDELSAYGCQHINLEDIGNELASGRFVTETYRDDPNIRIRGDIYQSVFNILKEQWFFGIGFGAVSAYLGTDERGAGLNASNIFLEVWLGTGLIGFLAFLFFWFGLGVCWFVSAIRNTSPFALSACSLWAAVTVFNCFNSGLLLGWLFVLLSLLVLPHRETYGD